MVNATPKPTTRPCKNALRSNQTDQISAALAAAQAEMENVVKNSTNDFLKTKFADLAAVRDVVVPPCNKHGIAVSQTLRSVEGEHVTSFESVKVRKDRNGNSHEYPVHVQVLGYLRTELLHSSGQFIASECPIVCNWADPHALGGTITYLRRYELAAAVGLAQADDDGESAKQRGNYQAAKPAARKPAAPSTPPPVASVTLSPAEGATSSAAQIPAATPPPAPPAAPKPAASKAPERPKTGRELDTFAKNNRIDPQLKGFIAGYFVGRGYPLSLAEWSDEQVATAWPTIRDHLQRVKLAEQAGQLAGAGV
jgi:hypothetical protein